MVYADHIHIIVPKSLIAETPVKDPATTEGYTIPAVILLLL